MIIVSIRANVIEQDLLVQSFGRSSSRAPPRLGLVIILTAVKAGSNRVVGLVSALSKGWVAGLFVNGTLGPQPVGNTLHGGLGLRINYWRRAQLAFASVNAASAALSRISSDNLRSLTARASCSAPTIRP